VATGFGSAARSFYDGNVEFGGVLAIALVAAVLGWLAAVLVVRRQYAGLVDPASVSDPLPRAILGETRTGYAVLDEQMHVLLANSRAAELDVVRAGFPTDRIVEAARRALVSREPVDVDLSDHRGWGSPAVVHAEVRTIGDDQVLVIAADESAAARVEAVRRDFVGNVSHELKTPIGSVLLLAEAVLDAADDEETVRHFTGKIVSEATRLSTLVTELIALSKLQGAATSMEHVPVSIDAVIDDALAATSTIVAAAGTEVTVGGTPGLLVRGDRVLLTTALVNLMSNAVHHSPLGTPVTLNRVLRGSEIELSVTDRGTGIPLAHQERVFERFFRGDPARSRATGGTGLGLAIVKHIAANHDGSVTLWSRVGTGSTFTLHLPCDDALGEQSVGSSSTSDSPPADTPATVEPMIATRNSV
jgi:two-component system sensor histidine kinase SenX3